MSPPGTCTRPHAHVHARGGAAAAARSRRRRPAAAAAAARRRRAGGGGRGARRAAAARGGGGGGGSIRHQPGAKVPSYAHVHAARTTPMSYPDNAVLQNWLSKETPEDVLEPDLPIIDPVRQQHAAQQHALPPLLLCRLPLLLQRGHTNHTDLAY
jgi:hypothetical protein